MHCCSNCFADEEIKAIIQSSKIKGSCDFCGASDTPLYNIEVNTRISEILDPVLDVYTPLSLLPKGFNGKTALIKDILKHDWKIFNLHPNLIYKLIISLCKQRYKDQPELFNNVVGIRESTDTAYLKTHSILKDNKWEDFEKGIKTKNRFHSNFINTDLLDFFLQQVMVPRCKKDNLMFRARICPDKTGFSSLDMGAPPEHLAKDGRVNPVGISILYLSNEEKTTLHEVRAALFDYVTIGIFELQEDIRIIKLSQIDHISPSLLTPNNFDLTEYAINLPHLRKLALEIAKPIRNFNVLDYLPTQYICDFIRSKGYDGIEYNSTMHEGGVNLAIFEPNRFKCTRTKIYEITSINYEHKPV